MADFPKPPDGGGWDFIIDAYSRQQALADGFLIAVDPGVAREAGFIIPIALTAAVWADCVAWPDTQETSPGEETRRLRDVLHMAHRAIARLSARETTRTIGFRMHRVPAGTSQNTLVDLVITVGPGDHGEPVFTIRFAGEH